MRLITAYAVLTVGDLFKQQINWHWITFSEYPQSELHGLFNCFKSKFTFDGLEEELKAVFSSQVKERFKEYMKSTKDEVFKNLKQMGSVILIAHQMLRNLYGIKWWTNGWVRGIIYS